MFCRYARAAVFGAFLPSPESYYLHIAFFYWWLVYTKVTRVFSDGDSDVAVEEEVVVVVVAAVELR